MPIESSQGTTMTFGGTEFSATNIKVKFTGKGYDQRVDVSTLDLSDGSDKVYENPPLFDYGSEGRKIEISCTFLGISEPNTEDEQTLVCSKFGLNTLARCTEFELEAAVSEKIKGSATFVIPG
jgi:hypothetical protein